MQSSLRQFSGFVGEMNDLARHSDAHELASWAVHQLSESVGFDCAWYGWAELKEDRVDIHAQAYHNLTDNYYGSWCEMAEQDLQAEAIRRNPERTAVYDRSGTEQTEGMIALADEYGLKKMATATSVRPGRTSSFYISGYRGSRFSKAWCAEELEYLHCAVDHLSSAMKVYASEKNSRGSSGGKTIVVNENGIVILGLQNVREEISTLWPEWKGDQIPAHLRSLIDIPGEHVLVDRQLIVKCHPTSDLNDMGLRKLSLRQLTSFDLLTQREREVACLLAVGYSHKEAARSLGVAPATVRNQTQSIYKKLDVNSRAELAIIVQS